MYLQTILKDGDKYVGDIKNPPVIKRKPGSRYIFEIAPCSTVHIRNVILDYNFINGWEQYVALIRFSRGWRFPKEKQFFANILLDNVTFIDSANADHDRLVHRQKAGDSWGINFTTDGHLENVVVQNCNNYAKHRQLCAGGARGSRYNIVIKYNYVEDGYANPIAVSGFGEMSYIHGVQVLYNRLYNCISTGVFLGRDGSNTRFMPRHMNNCDLRDCSVIGNHIHWTKEYVRKYPIPILLKGGAATAPQNLMVKDNVLDLRELNDVPKELTRPRYIVVQGQPNPDGTPQLFGNNNIVYANKLEPPVGNTVRVNSALIWNPEKDMIR